MSGDRCKAVYVRWRSLTWVSSRKSSSTPAPVRALVSAHLEEEEEEEWEEE